MPRVEVPEYKTHVDFPDDMTPEQMQSALTANFPPKKGVLDGIKSAASSVAAGINDANASFLETLDKGARKVGDLTGFRTGGGFAESAKAAREGAAYWRKNVINPDGLADKIYSGIGSAPMGIAKFSAGVPFAAAEGAMEYGAAGAARKGIERFAVGKVFKGLEQTNLSPIQKSGAMAGTMAAQTAAEGGSLQDIVAAGVTGLALSVPGETGAKSVVHQRIQKAGTSPEIAADLAGRSGGVEPQGPGYVTAEHDQRVFSDTQGAQRIADSEFAPDFGRPKAQVQDAEVSSVNPQTAVVRPGAHPDAVSIEVAKLKQEHPFWSDAEYLNEAQRRTFTHNPEVLPAATDTSFVRPVTPEPIRQSEDAPGLRRGLPIGDQESGQRFGTVDRIADPAPAPRLYENQETIPARTDFDRYAAPEGPQVRPAESTPSRTVEPVSMENFNHDSLPTAAVTAKDSLDLQNKAPQLKVAVVGTPAEIKALSVAGETQGKVVMQVKDKAYVIDPAAAKSEFGSVAEAKRRILKGGDAEAEVLGYPAREGVEAPTTAAVTKTGEILTEPEAIKQAATAGEVAYAAEGAPVDVAAKTENVAKSLQATENVSDVSGRSDRIKPGEHPGDGNIVRDAAGNEYLVMGARNSIVNVVPIRDGKAEVSRDSRISFNTNPDFLASSDQTRTEPLYSTGRNYYGRDTAPADPTLLHAGIHLPSLVKHYFQKLDTGAAPGSVKEFLDRNRAANERFGSEPLSNRLRRILIDGSANVQGALMRMGPDGEFTRRAFDSISGASAKAQLMVEKQREALKGMSLREQQAMGDLIAIDRDLAITRPGYTKIAGKTAAELQAARASFAQDYKLTPAEMQRVENASRQYFDAWKVNTQRLLDAGMITPEQKTALDAQDYSPKQFLEKIDPDTPSHSVFGGTVSVPDSGIKRLKEGSDGYFRSNPMRLLSEATARIETRIARNEANQALAKLPAGNGIAEVVKPGTAAPSGYEAISYMENGQQRTIHMKSEYAKEWRQNDPLLNSELANALQWVSGAKVVRAFATGYNPAFLVTNTPRDLVTIWMQPRETQGVRSYSAHPPVAAAEMAVDLKTVAKDAWTRKGRYVDYVNQGGGRELLTHYGALSSRRENLAPAVAKVQKTLSYVNEFSEIITRLAYRERLIKNGMEPQTASRMAAEYVDFSRGGTVAKAIDRLGVPYLNAALQGTRSIARSAAQDPAGFMMKTAYLMVGVAGLYAVNQLTNPEGYANVSDRDKADNFIIMLPKSFEYVDKDGTTVSPYLKVSKEQSMRPFAAVAELATHWANGGKPSAQQLQMALGGAVPIALDKMPPTAAALWTYLLNADTYRKQPVWKGKQEVEPYAEYTNNTNPIYRDLGRLFTSKDEQGVERGGVSPERLRAAVDKVIPSSNAYAQAIGNRVTEMYEPEDIHYDKETVEKLRSMPGVSRMLGGARDTEQFREGIREARVANATELLEANKKLDSMVLRYVKGGSQDADLYQQITSYVGDNERLANRVEDVVETANLPDRGWWLSVKALSPEDRADQFKARLKTVTPEEQQRMLQIADGLSGFVSDRFMERYGVGE